jgi:hypothetical protein
MTGHCRLGENLKQIFRDLISILSRNLPSGTDKSHKHLSEERVFRQRLELGTFRNEVDTLLGAGNIKIYIRESEYEKLTGLIWLTLVTGSEPL